jgi:hypothetical protein
MAQLKNFDSASRVIKNRVVNSLQSSCKVLVERYLENQLESGVDAKGERFPEKRESTKKAYDKKGYDTTHWLIRTGKSTGLNFNNTSGGFKVSPFDAELLKKVRRADDWFTLNETITQQIIHKIKEDLKR